MAETCFRRDVPTNTDFLNLSEQTIFQYVSGMLPPVRYVLSGGFESSERKVVCFLPSYEEELIDPPYDCVKIDPVNRKFAEELSHRDYLGAIMNLGIERSMLGDIVIKDGMAQAAVNETAARDITMSISKIGRTGVKITDSRPFELTLAETEEFRETSCTAASLRLDCIVAAAAKISREKAAALIRSEKTEVNHLPVSSVSAELKEGDILSIRGCGRFILSGINGTTKKGRIHIILKKYI